MASRTQPHPPIRRQIQLLSRLHVEGGIPRVEIPHGHRAERVGRMTVDRDSLAQRGVAHLGCPRLRVGEEEALVPGEALDHGRLFFAQRSSVGIVGRGKAGDVGDVLAKRQLAVDVETRKGLVRVELCGQRLSGLLESFEILRRPPVAQAAGRIEQRAVVVEAVADLVADRGADRAVIERRISLRVEERPLQNGGREIERVPGPEG